jgi:pimeloyl-ACP methyl ester carboxylesterase
LIGWCDANGAVLRYCIDGDGPPDVVLLHEMGSMLENLDPLTALLRERGLCVLRQDLRGCGLSQKLQGDGTRLDDLAEDLRALIALLAPGARPVLAGCALGAAVALRAASADPALCRAVVAMSAPVPSLTGARPGGAQDDAVLAATVREQGMRTLMMSRVEQYFHVDLRSDADFFEQYRLRMATMDGASYLALTALMRGIDLGPDLDRIAVPVMLMRGSRDRLRPAEDMAAATARLGDGEHRVVDSGHFVSALAPAAAAAGIFDMLAKCAAQEGRER